MEINYQECADKAFEWFEANEFERTYQYMDRNTELMFAFADWVEQTDNLADVSGISSLSDDVDEIDAEADKLVTFISKGIDKYVSDMDKVLYSRLNNKE